MILFLLTEMEVYKTDEKRGGVIMAKKETGNKIITPSMSRKKFIKGAGSTVAGVALLGGVGSLLTGCGENGNGNGAAKEGDSNIEVPEHPFEYKPLDPDKVAERAYDAYMHGVGDGGGG